MTDESKTKAQQNGAAKAEGEQAAHHDASNPVDSERLQIAVSQAERQWGRDPRRNIRKHLDEAGEQSVIAQFLNGAFAQWVERYTGCRWLPVRPEELDSVHSNSDYAQLLYSHLQGKTAEVAS